MCAHHSDNQVSSEKYLLQASKKRKEYSKADVRLPELNYNHLPELRALEGLGMFICLYSFQPFVYVSKL